MTQITSKATIIPATATTTIDTLTVQGRARLQLSLVDVLDSITDNNNNYHHPSTSTLPDKIELTIIFEGKYWTCDGYTTTGE